MKKTKLTLYALLTLFFSDLNAQSEYMVLLHSGNQIWAENAREYADEAFISSQETVDGNYYRFLQFYKIPNQNQLNQIAQNGIELLEYLPNKAYIASVPVGFDVNKLPDLNVRSILPIVPKMKMALQLQTEILPEWALHRNEIQLMLKYYKNLDHENILRYCANDKIQILQHNGINNFIKVSIPKDRIEAVAALPYVSFLEAVPEPSVPDDVEGRSLHRANVIDTQFPSGRHYTGEGINVLCRDDGDVGPHIDFHGRQNSDFVGGFGGSHGDGVSGIMAGAGNLNPRNRGMAAGAGLYVTDYEETFLDVTMMLFFDHNVIVTNSSYSNGCNAGYTAITQTVDDQIFDNKTLLHVFSAGNSNGLNCGYGAGNQWGNITGGHKQGKNAIATANLYNDASLVNSSSHGPAHDGRIKPDIAANGENQVSTDPDNTYGPFGGTSGAAPGIAGITAMLHQAYKQLHGDVTAESGLLKAVLLNSANDLGRKGPDFEYGWGHVNAYRAALTLEENRWEKHTIMTGDTNTHKITIPDGVLEARIMTYWMDPSGTVMTSKALVNDLDSKMIGSDSSMTEYLPWWLDPTPDPVILSTPAVKGEDHLNNMEQIHIENPEAGEYNLEVTGFELPFGSHEYYIVWEFRTEDVTLIYPIGGENLVPGEVERVHWDAVGQNGNFDIYYSEDSGMSWTQIGTGNPNVRQWDWTVPNTVSATSMLRIVRNSFEDVSDEAFNIAPVPQNLTVLAACPTYVTLVWDPLVEATSYNVYKLGEKYMDFVANTSSTVFDVPIDDPTAENWFAVGMQEDVLGAVGRRTIAVLYSGGLLNCILDNDVELVQINSPTEGSVTACGMTESPISVTVTNTGVVDQSTVTVGYQVNGGTTIEETLPDTLKAGESTDYTFMQNFSSTMSGDYEIKTWAGVPGDEAAFNDTAFVSVSMQIYPGLGEPIAYSEGFEGATYLPDFYSITNPDEDVTWDSNFVTGIDGFGTTCLWINSYFYSDEGQEDYLSTIPIDLIDATSAVLKFDVANARFNDQWNDALRVEISTDCGFTFSDVIYEKASSALATVPDQNGNWSPSSGDHWRTEAVDLTPFIGNSIVLKFTCINGFGSNLYLDNINIDLLQPPTALFSVNSSLICQNNPVDLTNESTGDFVTYSWDFGPNATPPTSDQTEPLVFFTMPGTETISLTVTNASGTETYETQVDVLPQPTLDFTYSQEGGKVTFINNSMHGLTYLWEFGDDEVSDEENPVHIYTEIGTFEVTLTVANDCGQASSSQTVDIMVGTNDPTLEINAQIMPNPTSDEFELFLNGNISDELKIDMTDIRGIILRTRKVDFYSGSVSQRFDISELPSGVYFVKIQGSDGFLVKRIVKE